MGARPGVPSLCRVFPAGVGLTLHITLIRERSLRTVYYRIRSICILRVKGYSKPRMAGAAGQKYLAEQISAGSNFNAELMSVPGQAGNLFFTGGPQTGTQPVAEGFYQSTNGGATWTAVPNVTEVYCFGFGAPAPGQSYPSIYIVGYVNQVYGIWESDNHAQSWTQIGTTPQGSLDVIKTISGDPSIYGQVYIGFTGSGYAYLPAAASSSAPHSFVDCRNTCEWQTQCRCIRSR